jgi:hypothetical protein
MSIIRAKRKTNYTIMSNVGLEDNRLSLKAKGMLAYLLSKPDNWQVSDRQLSTIGPDGRTAVQAALKELETYGYLNRTRVRREDGTFCGQSIVYDEPWSENPATVHPATVHQATENPAIISTVVTSPVVTITEQQILSSSSSFDGDDKKKIDRAVFTAWAENMPGTMTPILGEKLHSLIDECGAPAVIHGITAAVEAGARNLNYVSKCASNHAAGGTKPASNGTSRSINNGVNAVQDYINTKGLFR